MMADIARSRTSFPRGSVSVAFVCEIFDRVSETGVDPLPLLFRAGIPQRLLETPQARIPAERFSQLWLAVAQALDDEFFGLDTRRMKVGTYAALSRQAVQCAHLGDALADCIRWLNLILDDFHLNLASDPQWAGLEIENMCSSGDSKPGKRRFAHETLLVMIYGLACWLIDRHIPLRAVTLAYARPERAPEYDSIFAPGARFNAKRTRLKFAASVLQAPVVQNMSSLHEFLHAAPANFIVRYRNPDSPGARVRQRLQNCPVDQWPDFQSLARELGMAASTLHRQLAREGAGFGAIRDAIRCDRAIERLVTSTMPVARIAEELGFSEVGAFYRAFRRWTDARPGDYRKPGHETHE